MSRDKWLNPFIGDTYNLNGLYYIWCIDAVMSDPPMLSFLFYGPIDDESADIHIVDLTLDCWLDIIS